jgi:predicted RNA polymerase sigma factor
MTLDDHDEQMRTVHQAIEQAVRDSYGRLLAFLTARSHDVAAAEDALSDALHSALETWPGRGVPDKPEAWLLVAARRKLLDVAKHLQVREDSMAKLLELTEHAQQIAGASVTFPMSGSSCSSSARTRRSIPRRARRSCYKSSWD